MIKLGEIAESLGAKVKNKDIWEMDHKKHLVPYAKNDWILSIDADERLDLNAIEEIKIGFKK